MELPPRAGAPLKLSILDALEEYRRRDPGFDGNMSNKEPLGHFPKIEAKRRGSKIRNLHDVFQNIQ